jgi:integration host factor subunit beta
MNKSQLIEALAEDLKLPVSEVVGIVSTILNSMTDALVAGDNVEIRGFGSFTVRHYEPYQGRNPKTGVVTLVKAKKLPFFKVGKELREAVDAGVVGRENSDIITNADHYPNTFLFSIGGFSQGHRSVEFKDGRLVIRPSFISGSNLGFGEVEVTPTPSEWKTFWVKSNDLQVWKWKKNYSDNNVLDGTQWSLKIRFNGKTKNSYGSNSYPESFKLFLKALNKLIRSTPFKFTA